MDSKMDSKMDLKIKKITLIFKTRKWHLEKSTLEKLSESYLIKDSIDNSQTDEHLEITLTNKTKVDDDQMIRGITWFLHYVNIFIDDANEIDDTPIKYRSIEEKAVVFYLSRYFQIKEPVFEFNDFPRVYYYANMHISSGKSANSIAVYFKAMYDYNFEKEIILYLFEELKKFEECKKSKLVRVKTTSKNYKDHNDYTKNEYDSYEENRDYFTNELITANERQFYTRICHIKLDVQETETETTTFILSHNEELYLLQY